MTTKMALTKTAQAIYILVKEGSWQVNPHPETLQHFCISWHSLSELHLFEHAPVLGCFTIGQKPSLIDRSVEKRNISVLL